MVRSKKQETVAYDGLMHVDPLQLQRVFHLRNIVSTPPLCGPSYV